VKTEVHGLDGSVVEEIELPAIFEEEYRPDIIKRAVLALQSTRLQPHGAHPYAGIRTSAHSWGSGRGVSHVPRIKNGSRAARVPQARGGREAHPPVVQKVLVEKINKKEKRKALLSAVAATIAPEIVRSRGHRFTGALPLIVTDAFGQLEKTADVITTLSAVGVYGDIERSKASRKVRAGRGKMRGRRMKQRKSVLIVTADAPLKAAANLPGVDTVSVGQLNCELLAPGTVPGRLTLWTVGAVRKLEEL
jgi:large subunit ribosomal protein L4e